MSKGFLRAWLALTVVLLSACHQAGPETPAQPGGATPTAAAQVLVDRLKADDFAGYWRQGLPAAEFQTMQADWTASRQAPPALKPAESARINSWLQQFNAPNAEANLQAQWLPKLAIYQRQYADQLPMLMSVMQMVAGTAIDQSSRLDPSEKAPLHTLVGVIGPWAGKAPWFDRDKAKQGITIAVNTIHGLGIQDVQSLAGLDFQHAMSCYARFFKGLKQWLALYGLDLDASLRSVHISATPVDAHHVQLNIDYRLLDQPLSLTTMAVQIDHRWYLQSLIDAVQQAHQRLLETPTGAASSAAAATAAAPAAAASAAPAAATSATSHR